MFRLFLVSLSPAWLAVAILIAPAAFASQRHALLIGVSDYDNSDPQSSLTDLDGPKNDVLLISSVLRSLWDDGEIRILADSLDSAAYPLEVSDVRLPTRANIAAEFERLANEVAPGDEVFIHFSGHGAQVSALPEDRASEAEGMDQAILPIDAIYEVGSGSGAHRVDNIIRDNDVRHWLDAIRSRGAFVWLSVDACFSGSMERSMRNGARQRFVGRQSSGPRKKASLRSAPEGFGSPVTAADGRTRAGSGFVGFYAAYDNHKTLEHNFQRASDPSDSVVHGTLTWFLSRALLNGTGATYATLAERVRIGMWDYSLRPKFVGELGREPMAPWRGASEYGLFVDQSALIVRAGRLHGISPGSILDVFWAPEPEATPLFSARVERAGLETSTLEILPHSTDYPSRLDGLLATWSATLPEFLGENVEGLFAKANTVPIDFRYQVRAPNREEASQEDFDLVARALDAAMRPDGRISPGVAIEVVGDGAPADVELHIAKGSLWFAPPNAALETHGPHHAPSLPLADLTSAKLLQTIAQMARARNILRIAGKLADADVARGVRVHLSFAQGALADDPVSCRFSGASEPRTFSENTAEVGRPASWVEVPFCSEVFVEIRNDGPKKVDVTPFYFERKGGIDALVGYDGPDGANYVMKLAPGEDEVLKYREDFTTYDESRPNTPEDVVNGPMHLVLFITESDPADNYTIAWLRYIASASPAAHRRTAASRPGGIGNLVELLDQAGAGTWVGSARARLANVRRSTGAVIIPIEVVAPRTVRK